MAKSTNLIWTYAAQLPMKLLATFLQKEGEVENFDFSAAIFSLFVSSIHIHILTQSGWTTDELINEVMTRSEHPDIQN